MGRFKSLIQRIARRQNSGSSRVAEQEKNSSMKVMSSEDEQKIRKYKKHYCVPFVLKTLMGEVEECPESGLTYSELKEELIRSLNLNDTSEFHLKFKSLSLKKLGEALSILLEDETIYVNHERASEDEEDILFRVKSENKELAKLVTSTWY